MRNKLNTLRASRDSWVKYEFIFNRHCPQRRRRRFLDSLMTFRYWCRYQDHAAQTKHVIRSFFNRVPMLILFRIRVAQIFLDFFCELSLITKSEYCDIISVFDGLVCLFVCSFVHFTRENSFLSSCLFTELIYFPSDKCFVYILFKRNF